MRNCDVWKSEATFSSPVQREQQNQQEQIAWSEPQLLCRTKFATSSALERTFQWPWKQVNNNNDDDDKHNINSNKNDNKTKMNVTIEEEPVCRICQATREESPGMAMVRPCRCSGSLTFVHIECLNRWRQTSTEVRI